LLRHAIHEQSCSTIPSANSLASVTPSFGEQTQSGSLAHAFDADGGLSQSAYTKTNNSRHGNADRKSVTSLTAMIYPPPNPSYFMRRVLSLLRLWSRPAWGSVAQSSVR
jgi:hypothetical protein